VPSGPVSDYAEVFAHRQVTARGIVTRVDNPCDPATTLPTLASPVRLSATPVSYRRRPPRVGENADEILGDCFGFDAAEIERYRRSGALG
jgi:crotonobetainyl-CoA:carnitine CoA-transferase CaiB-like acyl-CoA transferase